MRPAAGIQRPTVISQVPRPLDSDNGKTHTSDVHNLVNSRKRKRSELAVAADGESVNIYDVKSNQLLTSHPVPPQSFFACPPCSVRQKISRSSPVLRRTFCALQTPEPEIILFSEERKGNSITNSKCSHKISSKGPSSQILALDVIPTKPEIPRNKELLGEDDVDLICVHRDGRVRRVSGDLREEVWSVNPIPKGLNGKPAEAVAVNIQAAFLMDLEIAQRSILKRREDILATLPFSSSGDTNTSNAYSILITVSHSDKSAKEQTPDVSVDFFAIPWIHEPGSIFNISGLAILHLTRSHISYHSLPLEEASDIKLHQLSGTLYFKAVNDLLAFDLCDYIPRLVSHTKIGKEFIESFLRLSSSSVITSTAKSVNVYNVRYQSLQASIQQDDLSPQLGKKKRQPAPLKLVSYFPKLNVAVALQGSSLVGMQLSLPATKRGNDGLLIDSIGRGIDLDPATMKLKQPHYQSICEDLRVVAIPEDTEWNIKKAELDTYVLSQNVTSIFSFEEAMAWELSRQLGKQLKRFDALSPGGSWSKSGEMENGSIELVDQGMVSPSRVRKDVKFHLPSGVEYVDQAKVHYLLSKIFSWEKSDSASSMPDRLKISFFPSRLFRWLVTMGKLSPANVELALRKESDNFSLLDLPSGSIVQALAEFDPSLQWLIFYLQESASFSTDELVLTVKVLLQYDSQGDNEESKLLKNGVHHPIGSQELASHSSRPSQSPRACGHPSPSLLSVTTALNLTLSNLHAHHSPDNITKSLRSHLNPAEKFTIVHHLRLCLASGGWTSRFTDQHSMTLPDPSNPQELPQLTLSTVTTLLNCTIDAIGATGFLFAVSATPHPQRALSADDMDLDVLPEIDDQEEQEEDLIPFMKAEISAALAGIEESSYLRGILREFLRYASSQPKGTLSQLTDTSAANPALAASPSHSVIKQGPAEIHTLISSGPDGTLLDGEKGALPLSLKAEGADKDMKTRLAGRSGQRVERSKRDTHRLKSMRVGKYSFERIVF